MCGLEHSRCELARPVPHYKSAESESHSGFRSAKGVVARLVCPCLRVLACSTALVGWLPDGLGLCAENTPNPATALKPPVNPKLIPPRPSKRFSSINPLTDHRLVGVMPDFGTVQPAESHAPLTLKQKWDLMIKGTIDPFNLVNSAMTAAFAQEGNQTPRYGEGRAAYGERFGAAVADGASQSVLGGVVFAQMLHQDPRYFRLGPEVGILHRALYSVSRLMIVRTEAGKDTFNSSGMLGAVGGIGISNLYYPSASIRSRVMAERLATSFTGVVSGHVMAEFVPDLEKFFFPRLKSMFFGKPASQN